MDETPLDSWEEFLAEVEMLRRTLNSAPIFRGQRDAFMAAEHNDTVFSKGRKQQGFCWKYTIPATERTKVLRILDEHNLNAFSLFGSEESMMETLATREFLPAAPESVPAPPVPNRPFVRGQT